MSLTEHSADAYGFEVFDHYNDSCHYDSFVFGNSRTLALKSDTWKPFIDSDKIFCFASPGECFLNINKKLKYISGHGNHINHAIILVDGEIIANHNNSLKNLWGPVYTHHPKSTNSGYLDYYLKYIKFYFEDFYYIKYIYYLMTDNYGEWMSDAFNKRKADPVQSGYNLKKIIANESDESSVEKAMKQDYTSYYETHNFSRPDIIQPEKFDPEDLVLLREIKEIFTKEKTEYKILVSPNYINLKLNPSLSDSLVSIFGSNNVFDFSGVKFTSSDTLFYMENSHYTTGLGALMLDSAYSVRK